jgi:hypothetical protein
VRSFTGLMSDQKNVVQKVHAAYCEYQYTCGRLPTRLLLGRQEQMHLVDYVMKHLDYLSPDHSVNRAGWSAIFTDENSRFMDMRPIPVQLETFLEVC